MKSSLSEVKFLFLTLTATFLLMAIHYFQPQLSNLYHPDDFAGIHTFLEFIGISISLTIFIYGLKSFGITHSSRMLLLSLTFLTVAAIDLLHTFSFEGMPHFITNSSAAKATCFWVIARGFESIFMLALIIWPNRKVKRDCRLIVVLAALLLAVSAALFVFNFSSGLTNLLMGSESHFAKTALLYGFSFLKFLAIIIILYQYYLEKNEAALSIALALVLLLFSELIVTTYQNVNNIDNLTGHLFKIFGYLYLLKGFYLSEDASELNKLFMLISEQPGFIFQLEIRRNECTCTFCEGSLMSGISINTKEVVSKQSLSLFKILGHSVEEYCLSPGNVNEQQTFKTRYMDKTLLISIRRLPRTEGTRSIIGNVIEIKND